MVKFVELLVFLTLLIRHLGYTWKRNKGSIKGMTSLDAYPTGDHAEANAWRPCGVQCEETLKFTDSRHRNPKQKSDTCSDSFVGL